MKQIPISIKKIKVDSPNLNGEKLEMNPPRQ